MVAPIRYLSRRIQEQKIGILQSTEEEKVLEVIGRVGIGTTIFDAEYNLDVRGTANVSGILSVGQIISGAGNSFSDLNISGIATFQNDVIIGGGLTVSGVSTFTGAADFNGDALFDGYVAIGTTNPLVALDVAGNIREELHTPAMPVGLNEDIGLNWTKVNIAGAGLGVYHIDSLAYCGDGIVLAGDGSTTGDIYRSTDYGLTFTQIELDAMTGEDYEFIFAIVYCGNGIALAGAGFQSGDGDILRSTDYGVTWTKSYDAGATIEYFVSLTYCGNGIVLAGSGSGTGDGDVYRSTDFGLTFTKVEMGADLEAIRSLEYCGDGIALAGSGSDDDDGDIYRSTDYGATWTKIEMGSGLNQIVAIEYCGNGIVLAGGGTGAGEGDIYRSTDYGLTYTQIEVDTALETVSSLAYCDNGIVLAGGGSDTGDGDIFKSADYGLTWTKIELEPPGSGLETIRSLLYLGNGIALAGSRIPGDIYRSDVGFSQATSLQGVYHEHLTGNIGIGSTQPTAKLDVNGDVDIDGHTELDDLNVSGVSTFTDAADFNGDVDIDGHTELDDINVSGVSTFAGAADFNSDVDIDGHTELDDLNVSGVSTFTGAIDANGNLDVDGHTELDDVNIAGVLTATTINATTFVGNGDFVDLDVDGHTELDDVNVSGAITATTFSGDLTGTATTATSLETARTFEITGDVVASAISFDGTGNVSLAATIQPNSVELGTDTTGDYVQSITGTSNEIEVTGGTGESSTPQIGLPNDVTISQDLTVTRDVNILRNLDVTGNITVGGTSATIFTQTLQVEDPDIVLGIRTDGSGNDISTDNTANHGGIAIASTEGNPLVNLNIAGIETLPPTYKKIMWFKSGSFAGLATDAWLTNYAFGIGTTSMSSGTRLAVGNIEFNDDDITSITNINATGIITSSSFSGNGASLTNVDAETLDGLDSTQFLRSDVDDIKTGVTTFSDAADFNGDIDVDGHTELDDLNVSGVSTFTGAADFNGNVDVDGHTELDDVNVSGVSTFTGAADFNGDLDVDGHTELDDLNVSGVSTFVGVADFNGDIDVDGHTELDDLNVSGVSTFVGVADFNGDIDVDGHTELDDLNVSGVSTFAGDISIADKITHIGDTDTAIRFPAVDTFTVETAGAERFRITSDGDVGIGTTNPSQLLDVNGDVRFRDKIFDSTGDSGVENYVLASGGPGSPWSWKIIADVGAGNLDAIFVRQDGSDVGTGGTNTTLDFYENFSLTQPVAGIASIRLADTINIDAIDINETTLVGSATSSLTTVASTPIYTGLSTTIYRSVEYTIQATEGNNFQSTKILALHDGTTAYHSEYGTIFNNSSVATFDVDVSSGNIRLVAVGATSDQTDYVINFTATKL